MPIPKAGNGNGKTCTMSKIFIDTNILVYSLDRNEKEKQAQSRACLKMVPNGNRGVRIENPLALK